MNTSFKRPYRPVDLNEPTTKAFPLMSMSEKLMAEANSATSGPCLINAGSRGGNDPRAGCPQSGYYT